jgi:hypothetical protein
MECEHRSSSLSAASERQEDVGVMLDSHMFTAQRHTLCKAVDQLLDGGVA